MNKRKAKPMSDHMLHSVLNMPLPNDPAGVSVLDWMQFKNRAAEASQRIAHDADRIKELEAKLAVVIWELKRSNDALEALRPVWAQGWTNDSVAAQASGAALAQLWNMLGVQNQTQAMATLAELKGKADE